MNLVKTTFLLLIFSLVWSSSGCKSFEPPPSEFPESLQKVWRYPIADGSGPYLIGKGPLVLVFDRLGTATALDAQTGKEKWTFKTLDKASLSPDFWEGLIFITSYDGGGISAGSKYKTQCIEAETGKELWHFDQWETYFPLLRNGMIVGQLAEKEKQIPHQEFAERISVCVGLDARTGKERYRTEFNRGEWEKNHPQERLDAHLVGENGHMLMVNSTKNVPVIDFARQKIEMRTFDYAGETPEKYSIIGNTLLVISFNWIKNEYKDFSAKYRDLYLQAFDIETGKTLWTKKKSAKFYDLAKGKPGVVLVEDWEGNLMAYDVATGKELWPKPIFTGSVQHVTLDDVAENTLLARPGESSEWFLAYNATTGEKLWEQKTDDLNRTFWLYTYRGIAYVESTQAGTRFNSPVTLNVRLSAYDLKSGKKLWHILNYDLGNVVCFEDVTLIGMKSEVFAVKAGQ